MCVVSALMAAAVIVAAAIAEIILFYVNPSWLTLWEPIVDPGKVQSDNLDSEYLNENQLQNDTATNEDTINTLFQLINDTLVNDTSIVTASTTSIVKEPVDTSQSQDSGGGIGFYNTIYLIVVIAVGVLAAITVGLLLHLCFFHIYISYLGLTTYEYIRNQRQQTLAASSVPRKNSQSQTKLNGPSLLKFPRQPKSQQRQCSNGASKNLANEIYVCSKLTPTYKHRPKTLHCCNVSSTSATSTTIGAVSSGTEVSHKAFYLCSLLQEGQNSVSVDAETNTQTFHCCSEFLHTTQVNEDIEAESIIHYTEKCTFCSFRIKTPSKTTQLGLQDRITKHHRWRRKWNCCSNVPDSPDVPGDPLRTISGGLPSSATNQYPMTNMLQQHQTNQPNEDVSRTQSLQHVQIEVPLDNSANSNDNNNSSNNNNLSNNNGFMNGTNGHHMHFHHSNPSNSEIVTNGNASSETATCSNHNNHGTITNISSPTTSTASKRPRPKLVRPWPIVRPVVRLRHIFRSLGRYRRPRCRGINSLTIKQNQIRPLPGGSNESLSASANGEVLSSYSNMPSLPALPPPTRRKIKSPTDLQDLADTLSFIQPNTRITAHSYRRSRRKNVLRNRSPTLSPIHEMSNPTSPQPCRHSCSGGISSLGNSSMCGTVPANSNRSA